ncbi:protein diaphanous homolog 1-like [Pocillopora damicornis]|uniref:protein diaphanous homolog 1-like n=1 Tax=Pocillopora damicornis TaxID=46731 RepID=UPI000F54D11A|nr:protein diaphanous homolog 1-like [Pocillopora damicornis]
MGDKLNPAPKESGGGILNRITSMRKQTKKSKEKDFNGHKMKERLKSTQEEPLFDQDMEEEIERIRHLSPEEFNKMFEKMLEDMNLSENLREPIRNREMETKVDMLCSFKRRQMASQKTSHAGPTSPDDYIKELNKSDMSPEHLLKTLQSVRVSLTGRPLSWIQEFGEEGLQCLIKHLRDSCSKEGNIDKRIQHECVRCLKAFMNNKYGLNMMLKSDDGLVLLARSMVPSYPSMMADVVKVVAAVCLVKHDKALEAITRCGELEKQGRFVKLVEALDDDHTNLKVACVQLINALVSTPDELDFRLHLRNEFVREGLNEPLQELRDLENDDLNVQLDIFEEHRDDDSAEFQQRFTDIKINFEDQNEIIQIITNLIQDTPSEPMFLSILQHLLLIRDDVYARPQYYKLIEECISQIVLHRGGVDPDFGHKRIDIDVEPLIENLVEKAQYEEAAEKSMQLETKLELETTMRQECEAKLTLTSTNFETKIAALEKELAEAREQAKRGGPVTVSQSQPRTEGVAPPCSRVFMIPSSSSTPPPPPPGMGAPPPPFPGMGPRMPFGSSAHVLPPGVAPKKKYKQDVQLKRANWNKINMNNFTENTFWAKTKEEKLEKPGLFDELSKAFAAKGGPRKTESGDGMEKKAAAKKKGKDLKIIDPKSAQNLSIFLGSLKLAHKEVRKLIMNCDQVVLTESAVNSLLKYLPSPDQMQQLGNMKESFDDLSDPEQFVCLLSGIKKLEQRLNMMLFKRKFPEEMQDIKPNVVNATAACREVKTSPKFCKFLELVLLMGNYMNAGSRNEGSMGFEMNYLTKLSSTKSVDGQLTLVHFLDDTIEKKYPEISGFEKELTHVEQAARVSEEILQKSINSMQGNLKKLEKELETYKPHNDPEDKFLPVMEGFYKSAKDQIDVLVEMHKNMTTMYKELVEYFCLDTKKTSMEEFFGDIKTFLDCFENAKKDNAKRKEKEEKDRKARERAEKEKEKKKRAEAEKSKRKPVVDINADDDQEGVLDGLMEALNTGSAFRDPTRPARKKAGGKKARPVDLRRSRTRTNIPVQKIMEAQNAVDGQHNAVDINIDDQPVAPSRRKKDDRRGGGEKSGEGLEDEAQDILERLKKL